MIIPQPFVNLASRMLETGEREVVCGDLTEASITNAEALRDVLGLVVRRQAELWRDWRPGVCLAVVVMPLGLLLSVVSERICIANAITLWLTANNWDAYLLHNQGFWSGVSDSVPGVLLAWLAIGCWSWTCGFAAGSLSRRAVWSVGAVFCAVFLACALPGVLSGMEPIVPGAGTFHGNDAVFRVPFYRWMLPLAVQICLVGIPAVRGMWDGATLRIIPRRVKLALWLSLLVTVVSLIAQSMFYDIPISPSAPPFGVALRYRWPNGVSAESRNATQQDEESAMKRGLLNIAVSLLGIAALAQDHPMPTDVKTTPDHITPATARKPAPDFSLTDAQGNTVTLAGLKGKVVLLDFWATWCGGCKLEIPWYMEFDKKYRDRGLAVIGVSMDDEGMKVVKPFLAQRHIEYPVVIGDEAMGKRFGLGEMPLTLLIDKQGRLAVAHAGVVDRGDFESHIRELLQ